jgi:cytoskeleton protein RodZ
MSSDPYQHPESGEQPEGAGEPPYQEPPYEEPVGEILARAREAQGLTLDDVAHQLKFGVRQLEALEQSRFEDLPGSTFARGMVRSYARLLKLDADGLLARVEGKFEVPHTDQLATRYREPVPFSDGSRRSTIAYAALSVLILLVVAAVLFGWQQERSGSTRMSFVPAGRPALEPPKPSPKAAPGAPGSAREAAAPATELASAEQAPSSEKPAAAAASGEAAPAAPSAGAPPAPGAGANPAAGTAAASPQSAAPAAAPPPATDHIVLNFDAESWVEIRDGTGRVLMSQLNPAGSEKEVRGIPPFSVVIGNAQHVRLTYDDKPFDLAPHIRVEVARFTLK